jgi:hypothetical protein
MWHRDPVTFWLALRRLLPLLAVFSLALAPMTASAAAGGMRAPMAAQDHAMAMANGDMDGMAAMAMDDMPCCPQKSPSMPDCSEGCPLMALCLAKVATRLPDGLRLPVRIAVLQGMTWAVTASFDSVAPRPLPEPPRS